MDEVFGGECEETPQDIVLVGLTMLVCLRVTPGTARNEPGTAVLKLNGTNPRSFNAYVLSTCADELHFTTRSATLRKKKICPRGNWMRGPLLRRVAGTHSEPEFHTS